ncbi:hypothetical protein KKF34_02155 [Myxococcota bacterium]|nr:hypothetical protein [Myxococcota bacterium]MBU1495664.1 hypothetical protein [Myxococcota bacterium]
MNEVPQGFRRKRGRIDEFSWRIDEKRRIFDEIRRGIDKKSMRIDKKRRRIGKIRWRVDEKSRGTTNRKIFSNALFDFRHGLRKKACSTRTMISPVNKTFILSFYKMPYNYIVRVL